MIYLDYAATSFYKPEAVHAAVRRGLKKFSANPGRGGNLYAMRAAEAVYEARICCAQFFGAKSPECCVFTKNATEALNLAIKGLAKRGDEIVISPLEHNSVYRPARALSGSGLKIAQIDLNRPADITADFMRSVGPETALAVITQVSNVNGFLMPIAELARALNARKIPFIIDASQSAGRENIDIAALGAAAICTAGHKSLYGPQGTGLLIAGENAHFETVMEGGSGSDSESAQMPELLPERLEYGTLNVAGIIGLAAGIKFVSRYRGEICESERRLSAALSSGLRERGYRVFDDFPAQNRTALCSFLWGEEESEKTADGFMARGIALRAGLHCAPLAHAFQGTTNKGTVRASVGAFTTKGEIARFLEVAGKVKKGR